MKSLKILTLGLLLIALAGCSLKPPKLYRPDPPQIISIGYTLAQYQADETAYNAAVKAGDLAGAKIARDRAVDGTLFAINNNYQQYAQGLMAVRDGAGVGTDLAQLTLAAGSNIFTNPATKNLLSGLLLGVKGASSSVQSRYYLNVPPEVIVLSMKAYRQPLLEKIATGQKQDALAYSLNQARSDLAELFWAGTLAGARLQITEQAGKAAQATAPK